MKILKPTTAQLICPNSLWQTDSANTRRDSCSLKWKTPSEVSLSNLIISTSPGTCFYTFTGMTVCQYVCVCVCDKSLHHACSLLSAPFTQHSSSQNLLQSSVTSSILGGLGNRRQTGRETYLVKQKDAWISQGHPQLAGISDTSAQLGWGKKKSHSWCYSEGVSWRQRLDETCSRHRGGKPAAPGFIGTRSSDGICAVKSPVCGFTAWSLTVHNAIRTEPRMDRLQLGW